MSAKMETENLKHNYKNGYKYKFCVECFKRLKVPNRKGVCPNCLNLKKQKKVLESKDFYNKKLTIMFCTK